MSGVSSIVSKLIATIDALIAHANRGNQGDFKGWVNDKDRLTGIVFALFNELALRVEWDQLTEVWKQHPSNEFYRLKSEWRSVLLGLRAAAETKQVLHDGNAAARDSKSLKSATRLFDTKPNAPRPPAEPKEQAEQAGNTSVAAEKSKREIFAELEPSVRKAYLSQQYAETMNGRELEDSHAYRWLQEHGIPDDAKNSEALSDYQFPSSFDTWRTYVTEARRALGRKLTMSQLVP